LRLQGEIRDGFDQDAIFEILEHLIFKSRGSLGRRFANRFRGAYPIPAVALACAIVGVLLTLLRRCLTFSNSLLISDALHRQIVRNQRHGKADMVPQRVLRHILEVLRAPHQNVG
jgi:hypothetical protein